MERAIGEWTEVTNPEGYAGEIWVVYQSEIVNGNERVRAIISARRGIICLHSIMQSFKKGLPVQKPTIGVNQ